MSEPSRVVVISSAAAVAVAVLAGFANFPGQSQLRADSTSTQQPIVAPQAVQAAQSLSEAFEAVHQAVANSVVNIHIVGMVDDSNQAEIQPQQMPDLPPGLKNLLPPGFEGPGIITVPQQPQPMEATGSGVIISKDGYIVTNNHVVGDVSKIRITVTLNNGRQYTAKIIGTDPKTDLAVIKIDANDLQPAVLGDSDDVQVGQLVCAFGSPFDLSQTMTQGIISATGRTDENIIAGHNPNLAGLTYEDFLQTDAPINPGNSGGALVDLEGHVIGINTAIASDSGASDGIGFSIPSNEVQYVANALIKYGHVERGYLGVGIADISDPNDPQAGEVARSFGYKDDHGVLVEQILDSNSAAAKGGLRQGDVITMFDGKTVENINQLRDWVARTQPGKDVTLEVFRDGKTLDLTFPVDAQPATRALAGVLGGGGENIQPGVAASTALGLTVSDMTDSLRQQLNIQGQNGVVVTKVDPEGVAANAGLEPGDVILDVQGQDVNSADDFNNALNKVNVSQGVRMTVREPNGTEMFVFLQSGNGQ